MTRFFIASAAAVLAVFASSGTARATDATVRKADAPREVVRFQPAELSTTDGANGVYDRINTAAWHVCSDMLQANTTPGALQRLQCIDTLVDAAVKDVNNPKLTAVHEEKAGGAYAPVS